MPDETELAPPPPADTLDFHERREILEANLARQIEATRASDAKVTLLVPTTTAMIGVLAALLRGAHDLPVLHVALATLPLLVAYLFMALSLIPRLRKGTSLLFFGHVTARDIAAYRADFTALTREAYLTDLAEQCYVTAAIARAKFRHVRNAYLAFFAALPFWALAIYLLTGGA